MGLFGRPHSPGLTQAEVHDAETKLRRKSLVASRTLLCLLPNIGDLEGRFDGSDSCEEFPVGFLLLAVTYVISLRILRNTSCDMYPRIARKEITSISFTLRAAIAWLSSSSEQPHRFANNRKASLLFESNRATATILCELLDLCQLELSNRNTEIDAFAGSCEGQRHIALGKHLSST